MFVKLTLFLDCVIEWHYQKCQSEMVIIKHVTNLLKTIWWDKGKGWLSKYETRVLIQNKICRHFVENVVCLFTDTR